MSATNHRVRRATLDDLDQLTAIWQSMRFPVEELVRHITEFQVGEGADGKALGGAALQIADRQGRIHHEGFLDFADAEALRPLLWERLQSVATNHGLLRLWTQEAAPFWSRCGMTRATPEDLETLPLLWRDSQEKGDWFTLKLRDDPLEAISLDKEFALFMESERQRTKRTFQQAKVLKAIATALALLLFILVVYGLVMVFRHYPQLLRR